ncbi:hypothetical protein A2W54_04770 [Candidatus Giovannonibacteria bacterium RIFCSPHIGHO2_02_43_13]|uniref:Uncharacterized protein n=1 Tax=Candidatus Giovannonibacteria bacterium RIFCSPHIGHO2_02_43_13 TaxID=1798330 RepID=A0A1F5WQG3_9BACT|nr:MAG: Penicillin-binding protein 1 [Parcubacteria group bacterium GW2011_GWA2_44_13]OGF74788.1 MAG: hypothetical protein A3E06_00260 [Candidatus Giovannonibacteria bacterium RIFCSPHIGHO2_12_FULL_44_42]OGF77899.1 MAG: hypothetical protein A2W54_04770 [Candidatus Giovannonibacteria bacterium RIFCSPHIGHO2_02_43_13]OGF90241.1 MAG: hypothetical protein A3I94_01680 [Candidatus Giovannonibacteria bacterium RIFCSPLOWO2_02_FULL_43_54]OGF96552.1 MAG: hypothetical protein A3H08_03420 [Candidatus Giovann
MFALFVLAFFVANADADGLPDVKKLRDLKQMESSFVYGSDGSLIGCFAKEYRTILLENEIPLILEKAIIASEDKNFYRHRGVDPMSIARAAWNDLLAWRYVEGGSTLTQQLAKNLFLSPEKTLERKFWEAILAIRIEKEYSKREILALYVNMTYLGRGRYGFEAAARTYFGKSSKDLTLAQSAFIVGLINRPSLLTEDEEANKKESFEKRFADAVKRKNRVLQLMSVEKFITADEYLRAYWEDIKILPAKTDCRNEAPYFLEEIRKKYKDELPLLTGGLKIYTTLDPAIQKKAEAALKNGLQKYRARHPENAEKAQGAVVVLDINTAEIRAMVGGENFWKSEFNNAVQAQRQPGSAFKPFADAAYLKYVCTKSRELCKFADSPFPVSMGRGLGLHYVENYPYSNLPRYRGFVNMDIQLAESRNAATMHMALEAERAWVKLLIPQKLAEHEAKRDERIAYYRKLGYSAIGAEKEYVEEHAAISRGILWNPEDKMRWLTELAKNAGINSKLQPYLVTAIGASEVNVLEITSAFIPFVNGGYGVTPSMIRGIYDSKMNPVLQTQIAGPVPVFDALNLGENSRIAENMKQLLRGVVDLPTGTAHSLRKNYPSGDFACKTGTATNTKQDGKAVPTDNWIICLTPKYAVGVWIGLSDKEDLGNRETGSINALPVFDEFIRDLIVPDEKFATLFEIPLTENPAEGVPIEPNKDSESQELFDTENKTKAPQ